jgi:hypothetical protein
MQLNTLSIGLFAISMVSIHFSPAIASISMGLLVFLGLFNSKHEHGLWLFASVLILGMVGIEWWHGCDLKNFKVVKNYLPLLFLPALIAHFKQLGTNLNPNIWLRLRSVLNIPLIWIMIASSLEYASHHRFYSVMILESKPMPLFSRVYHIEFSLIVAMQLLFTLYLFRNKLYDLNYSWMIKLELILLFLGIHFLSARTGLLAFWVGVLFLFSGDVKVVSKKWWILGVVLVFGLTFSLSSIRNRIINSWEDISAVMNGDDLNHKSFGQRWESWKACIHVISENPSKGVGACRFTDEHFQAYEKIGSQLRLENRIGPHNQWLQLMGEYGGWICGLLVVYLWAVFRNGFNFKNHVLKNDENEGVEVLQLGALNSVISANKLMVAFVACLFVASLFESILERQAGMWMLLFAVAMIQYPKKLT